MPRVNIDATIDTGLARGLIEIEGRRIEYVIQNKEYNFNDPEEIVRAAVYIELVVDYQYSPYCIDFEVAVPRRDQPDYADCTGSKLLDIS